MFIFRKIIRGSIESNPQLERLLPHVRGNIGFVFTNGDLKEVRDIMEENKVGVVQYQKVGSDESLYVQ